MIESLHKYTEFVQHLWNIEKNRYDLPDTFPILNGFTDTDYRKFFEFIGNNRSLRGHGKTLIKRHDNNNNKNESFHYFSQRAIYNWN